MTSDLVELIFRAIATALSVLGGAAFVLGLAAFLCGAGPWCFAVYVGGAGVLAVSLVLWKLIDP